MKVLFVSRGLGVGIGYRVNSISHYNALLNAVGEDNVVTVDLLFEGKYVKTKEALCYKEPTLLRQKVKRLFEFNRTSISNQIMYDILEAIQKYHIDIVYIDDATYGKLTRMIKQRYSNIPVITFYHDIVKKMYLKFVLQRPVFLIQAFASIYGEKVNTKYGDVHITLNPRDTKQLEQYYGIKANYEMPVCTGKVHEAPSIERCNDIILLFVGAKYIPNVKGIKWFYENVFEKLDNRCQLYVVGWQMEFLQESMMHERVHVFGSVPSLEEYYRKASVIIGPIFEGGGMKVKTAEALSFGKFFVGTQESLEGYYDYTNETVRNYIKQANNAEEFVYTINKAVKEGINNYYPEIASYYNEHYSEDALNNQMKMIIEKTAILLKQGD